MSREPAQQAAGEAPVPAPADAPSADQPPRVFMMGEFAAELPAQLRYTTNHMWAAPVNLGDTQRWRFGLTAYAVRLLQDVYFLDWVIDAPLVVARRQTLGSIESKKAESDLFSPTAGELVRFNPEALEDPSVINVDLYGDGWMFELQPQDQSDLLSVDQYVEHLEQAWQVAQRTIKGQL